MPVWLGLLILVAVAALAVVAAWSTKRYGQFSADNAKANREMVAAIQRSNEEATREITASTALLHSAMIDALATIARIRKDGGNLPPDGEVPPPVTFTAEDVA